MSAMFFFGNREGTETFMPPDRLKTAFYKAIESFPMLVGHVVPSSSSSPRELEVAVDRDNLNMPDYRETVCEHIHYSDITAAHFHRCVWPQGLMAARCIALPDPSTGHIRLVHAHMVRLKKNSGLIIYLSISHCLLDGFGYRLFIDVWAAEARALAANKPAAIPVLCFDRSSWIAWVAPTTRAHLLGLVVRILGVRGHLFRIRREKLSQLVHQISAYTPSGMRVTDNDVLTALACKTVAQATKEAYRHTPRLVTRFIDWVLERAPTQMVGTAVDIRRCLGIADANYTGNAMFVPLFENSLDQAQSPTTAESLAEIVVKVRTAIERVDCALVSGFYQMLKAGRSRLTCPMAGTTKFSIALNVTNQTRMQAYDISFGSGTPDFVTVDPEFAPGVMCIMAAPPSSADLLVNITSEAAVSDQICQNEFWMDMAELIY
ncbi:hypothetical protein FBU59_000852 [Linderina macrospora]|uniref:Uncharacterized protein n=1 Tax=Linderina macrospora TaxID=4868 RepID=A0ACC1JFQ5_9FUNG|nr:hypothetical protein FBU59_000852 [Linderina macrospora]